MAQTDFLQVADNAKTFALNNSLNNLDAHVVLSGIDTTLFPEVGVGYIVTIWDELTYPDPGDDSNREQAIVSAATISINGSLTLERTNPKGHSGNPRIAILNIARHIEDLDTAVNTLEGTADQLKPVAFSGNYNDLTNKPTFTSAVSSVAGKTGDVTLTKSDVSLTNVDNTADVSKPISNATQTALNAKADKTYVDNSIATTSASDRSRANHTGTQTATSISDFTPAADARITAQKGAAGGLAPIGSDGKIPSAYLPAYVDQVQEYATLSAFPNPGTTSVIYVATNTSKQYRWTGSSYAELTASPGSSDAVPEGTTNLYFTNERAQDAIGTLLADTTTIDVTYNDAGNIMSFAVNQAALVLAQTQITGLSAALAAKADLASPQLTGTPTAPTVAQADNSTKLATTAYVDTAIAAVDAANVNTFNGRGGTVLPIVGDYTASQITNVPAGALASTNIQDVVNELDTKKFAKSGGTITGNTTILKNDATDLTFSFQNLGGSRGTYFNFLANGSANPYMSLSGFTTNSTDPQFWNKLWQIGNNNSSGFSIWTNNAAGAGYSTLPALQIDYNQNLNIYGSALPAVTLSKDLGSSTKYWNNTFSKKVWLNATAAIDGSTNGVLIVTGSLKYTSGAAAGRVLTSDAQGKLTLQDVPNGADATNVSKGTVQLAGDLTGDADAPVVSGAHMTSSGFFMTDNAGASWRVAIDTDGSIVTRAIQTSGGMTGQSIGLALALTYA